MPTCKRCKETVALEEIHSDGICYTCKKTPKTFNNTTKLDKQSKSYIPKSLKFLNFFSELILILSIIVSIVIFNEYGMIKTEYLDSKLNLVGVLYAIAVLVQGMFISSIGFSVVYIGKIVTDNKQ